MILPFSTKAPRSSVPDASVPDAPPRLPVIAIGMLLGALLSTQVLAGGADVSEDEIYSDGVTLRTAGGAPLDINGDGNADLAVASNRPGSEERSRYYLGNGDGTFSAPVLLTGGPSSEIVAVHLNSDSFIDLVQSRRDLTDRFYLGDGAGGVGTGTDIAADTTRTLGVAIGDLDGDGDRDIVTANGLQDGSGAAQPNRYYLNQLVGSGTVSFAAGVDISADADNTRSIKLADLDGDMKLDVIVGNDHTTTGSNRVYLNESSGGTVSFAAGVDFGPADALTTEILIGDLNNDGKLDIVTLNGVGPLASPAINQFFLNASTPGVLDIGAAMDVSADTDRTDGGTLADFDGDGDLDLAVANFNGSSGESSRNRLYLNQFIPDGTVSFAAGIDISADEHMSHELTAVDLNGDGHIDIVVGNRDDVAGVPGRDRRYLNNGTSDPFTNVAPVIDGQAGVLQTPEDTALTIVLEDLEVTDPDNVFPADFTLTVQAGENYTVADNTITPAAAFRGNLTVPVIINDGTEDSEVFNLTVTVAAPSFTSTPVENATVDVAYSYEVTATDPDGDTLTITEATPLPAWLTLTDNGDATADLTGTPAEGDVGDHNVSLQVSDGTDTATQDFTITVAAAGGGNNPPTFTSTALTEATEDAAYSYDVATSDDDAGDTLVITAPTLPDWLALSDNGDGTAELTGTPGADDVGEHDVSLQVSDGADTATQDFTIVVEEAAAPPPPPPPSGGGGGGGGSLGFLSLLALLTFGAASRRRRRLS